MKSFTFNGKSSSEFGLIVRSKDRGVMPQIRSQYETIYGKDGSYDFSDNKFDDRLIEIECSVIGSSMGDLRYNIRRIAAWLYVGKKAQLVFDDEPDLYYMAKINNQINLDQLGSLGEFTLIFRCDPYAYGVDDVNTDQLQDMDLLLYRDRRMQDVFSFSITNPGSFEVNNYGTGAIRPIIEITGSFTTLTMTVGLQTLAYSEAITTETLTIDNEKYTAKIGVTNKLSKVSGSFIELPPGVNTVDVSGTGLNCTIKFLFNPKFI